LHAQPAGIQALREGMNAAQDRGANPVWTMGDDAHRNPRSHRISDQVHMPETGRIQYGDHIRYPPLELVGAWITRFAAIAMTTEIRSHDLPSTSEEPVGIAEMLPGRTTVHKVVQQKDRRPLTSHLIDELDAVVCRMQGHGRHSSRRRAILKRLDPPSSS